MLVACREDKDEQMCAEQDQAVALTETQPDFKHRDEALQNLQTRAELASHPCLFLLV